VKPVVVALAQRDFDPSEVAVTWSVLRAAGVDAVFATRGGERAHADPLMLTGEGLDPWGFVPGLRKLVVFGTFLAANRDARAAYAALERCPAFVHPVRYADVRIDEYAGLVLPGGHRAAGMRAYLEDATLQSLTAAFFDAEKPVGAICHGVVVAARAVSRRTGRSALYGRKTTALTWRLERTASALGRVVRFWDPLYYRTYAEQPGEPAGYRSVQAEVTRALKSADDFREPAPGGPDAARKLSGRVRDSLADESPAFVVRDGTYVSARWPGDVHTFAKTFVSVLNESSRAPGSGAAPI
jgi:putative intracellular protease/amidase